MDGGRRCEIVCSGRKLSWSRPNNLRRHRYCPRWGSVGPCGARIPPGVAKDGLVAMVSCPRHDFNTVGANSDSRPRRIPQGAVCCRDRSRDDRVLLVVSARVKRCVVRVGSEIRELGLGRIATVF